MPDQSPCPDSLELAKLAEGIRGLLAAADLLGLTFVGIHLCDALEAVQRELSIQGQQASQNPTDRRQR